MQRLTDQVAVVTGAARGIGRGIASVLGAEGARVVICDLDAELAESTATSSASRGSTRVAVATDVTDRASVDAMAARVVAEHGRIDILAANAGIYPTAELDDDRRRALGSRHGRQRQGRRARRPGLPAGDGVARLRPDRADLVDHRAGDGPAGVRALRRVEGRDARLHALRGGRARDERRHVNAVLPGNVDDAGLRRHERGAPAPDAVVDPDGALRRAGGRRLGRALPRLARRRGTSPARR